MVISAEDHTFSYESIFFCQHQQRPEECTWALFMAAQKQATRAMPGSVPNTETRRTCYPYTAEISTFLFFITVPLFHLENVEYNSGGGWWEFQDQSSPEPIWHYLCLGQIFICRKSCLLHNQLQ